MGLELLVGAERRPGHLMEGAVESPREPRSEGMEGDVPVLTVTWMSPQDTGGSSRISAPLRPFSLSRGSGGLHTTCG